MLYYNTSIKVYVILLCRSIRNKDLCKGVKTVYLVLLNIQSCLNYFNQCFQDGKAEEKKKENNDDKKEDKEAKKGHKKHKRKGRQKYVDSSEDSSDFWSSSSESSSSGICSL